MPASQFICEMARKKITLSHLESFLFKYADIPRPPRSG
jgi:hypothetical protein